MLDKLSIILEIPKAVCGGADILRTIKFIMTLLDVIFIGIPIVLILLIIIDFIKNVIASNAEDMNKNVQKTIKRIIGCVLLLLVPAIVNISIKILGSLGVDYVNCITIARTEDLSKYEVEYPPVNGTNQQEETKTKESENNNP